MNRKFVPCIYLYRGCCVRGREDLTVIGETPVALAEYYCANNADELIVFDLSEDAPETPAAFDALHDGALRTIKEICAGSGVDVIGAGSIKRLEDVKKLLYAGCKKVILDYGKDSNISMTKEASQRFGRDKIMVCCSDERVLNEQRELIEQYAFALLITDTQKLHACLRTVELPVYASVRQTALNKLLELLSNGRTAAVTGEMVNENAKEILSLKGLCAENGIPVESLEPAFCWKDFKKNTDGLVPVIVQDHRTDEVLMMAYMNEEAYLNTLKTGRMTYYSRSRSALWVKGETSGHYQFVRSLTADCDMDTILAKVVQMGVACHTGARSCFFNRIAEKEKEDSSNPLKVFEEVFEVIKDRKIHPKEGSYTNYLFDKGIDKILKKLGEEATEIVIAAKNPDTDEVKYEISDFLYHMMVLMAEKGVSWEEITSELANR